MVFLATVNHHSLALYLNSLPSQMILIPLWLEAKVFM